MIRDGLDPSVLDDDPEKPANKTVSCPEKLSASVIPLKDDPKYAKYFKMVSGLVFFFFYKTFSLIATQN